MSSQKPKLFLIILSLFLITCLCLALTPQEYVYHLKYIDAFGEIKHPTNTRLVSKHNNIGPLSPIDTIFDDRNLFEQLFIPRICHHLTGEVREYSGIWEDVETFYISQNITIGEKSKMVETYFFSIDTSGRPYLSEIALGVDYFLAMDYFHRSPLDKSKSYYFVYLLEYKTCSLFQAL